MVRCKFKPRITTLILMGLTVAGTFYTLEFVTVERLLHESKQSDKDFQVIEFLRDQQEPADPVTDGHQQRISTRCSKEGRGLQTTPNSLSNITLRHMIVSNRYKTLFCFVPKVACTNWKRIFHVLEGNFNTTAEIESSISHKLGLLHFLQDYSNEQVDHMLKTYKKITFVREPMERVLSAYRNKFAYDGNNRKFHHKYGVKIIKKYRKNFTGEVTDEHYTTFNEFVKYLIHLRPRDTHDEHWDLQYNLCSPCDINYDFIGKYDSLKSDAALALQLMGADKVVTFPDIGTEPAGRGTKSKMETFFSQVSEDEFMRLEKTYEKDYEFFEFDKPKYPEGNDR